MGQFFQLINLDKRQTTCDNNYWSQLSFSGYDTITDYLLHKDPEYKWAGDRLVYAGDEVSSVPKSLSSFLDDFKEEEENEEESDNESICSLYEFGSDKCKEVPVRTNEPGYISTKHVLRNLIKLEYVRANALSANVWPLDKAG